MSATQSPLVPPDIALDVSAFARALVAAIRTWQMYSPDHPATSAAVERLRLAGIPLPSHGGVVVGFSSTSLLVNGNPLPVDRRLREAAEIVHDHDILCMRFTEAPSQTALRSLLRLLTLDPESIRTRGGPVRIWKEGGPQGITLDQIDYDVLMADRGPGGLTKKDGAAEKRGAGSPPVVSHDAIWQEVVRSMSTGQIARGHSIQQRLVEIARSPEAIAELASEALQADPADEPSAKMAAQAATVLTVFQRLVRAVEAQSPDEVPDALRHLADAASKLDPAAVMGAVAESAESGLGLDVVVALGRSFDDEQVAELLARSLTADGRATARLASAVSTLTPDPARQHRVLTLARTIAPEALAPHVAGGAIDAALGSLELMLGGSGGGRFASTDYTATLADADARSYEMSLSTPAQMDSWISTVSADSVRILAVTLLIDLFLIEDRPDRINETADSLAAQAEDLLMAADTAEVERIVRALHEAAAGDADARAAAGRKALDTLARSAAMRDMSSSLPDFDTVQSEWFGRMCGMLGPAVLDALVPALPIVADGPGRPRLEPLIVAFGDHAVPPLVTLAADQDWNAARAAIQIIGRIGTPSATSVLHGFITGGDPRHVREAVIALMHIGDDRAIEPIRTAAQDRSRWRAESVVDALASSADRRASPILAALLADLDPLRSDHDLALKILNALRIVGDERAVPAIAAAMRPTSWLRFRRARRVKRSAISVLASMHNAEARAALDEAISSGDGLLRRLARHARGTGA